MYAVCNHSIRGHFTLSFIILVGGVFSQSIEFFLLFDLVVIPQTVVILVLLMFVVYNSFERVNAAVSSSGRSLVS